MTAAALEAEPATGQEARQPKAVTNWTELIVLTLPVAVVRSKEFLHCWVKDRLWTKRTLKHLKRLD
eukprot:6288406-Pyramimonas_sp.AAC.1